ncbi:hypothetical protein D3C77_620840 [compost metagenome]
MYSPSVIHGSKDSPIVRGVQIRKNSLYAIREAFVFIVMIFRFFITAIAYMMRALNQSVGTRKGISNLQPEHSGYIRPNNYFPGSAV